MGEEPSVERALQAVDLHVPDVVVFDEHANRAATGDACWHVLNHNPGTRCVVLVDELFLMADVKVHRFELDGGADKAAYTTVTVGGELGYRFFLWKGLYVAPVVRFWPNVWDDAPEGGVTVRTASGATVTHTPMKQGFGGFVPNVLIGWAFDVVPPAPAATRDTARR